MNTSRDNNGPQRSPIDMNPSGDNNGPQKSPIGSFKAKLSGKSPVLEGGSSGGRSRRPRRSRKPIPSSNDAFLYLEKIRDAFANQRGKYSKFLDIMRSYKALRSDTDGVIVKVKELFEGHPNLIIGFNAYLPKGHEIKLKKRKEKKLPTKKPVVFEDGIIFIGKLKERFGVDGHVYKSFVITLKMFRNKKKSVGEMYQDVAILFKEHQDLLKEFDRFMPDDAIPSASSGGEGVTSDEKKSE